MGSLFTSPSAMTIALILFFYLNCCCKIYFPTKFFLFLNFLDFLSHKIKCVTHLTYQDALDFP